MRENGRVGAGRSRRVWVAGAALVVLAAAGAAYGFSRGAASKGERAPDVAVPRLSGGTVSLGAMHGQVVLVNFWATWCPPCRVEMPGFQRVYDARRDDGFAILGLTTDRLPEGQIRWFLDQRGINYMVARATGEAAQALGMENTLPTSILIDTKGRIRKTVTGAYAEEDLVADVDALLREAGLRPTGEVAAAPKPRLDWMELRSVGNTIGDDSAAVTVVEFSDYGCAYCRQFTQTVFPRLYAEFIDTGRVRWVHVPFVLGKFANSEAASVAASCAAEQGSAVFWPVHMTLFGRQPEWRDGDPAVRFRQYVEEAGGDVGAFEACYQAGRPRETLDRAQQVASAAGVAATPTFFIDGRRLEGALPLEQFRSALEAAER